MSVHETTWPDGTPAWADLAVPDLETARRFYGSLLGWAFDIGPAEAGHYSTALVGGRAVAAIGPVPPGAEGAPVAWLTHLAASDAAAAADRAAAAGGQVVVAPMPVMDFGTMAVVLDPTGAVVALWQAGSHHGAALVNEPGAMIWNEHLSPAFEPAKAFYAALFPYTISDMSGPGFDYATLDLDGHQVGGIGGSSGAVGAWEVYFAVRDTDATAAEAERLGGTIVHPAQDSPYGRMAGITGPFGERFWLMSTEDPSSPPVS
jgi:predicted enzyme related to lactoylglutathione lyase